MRREPDEDQLIDYLKALPKVRDTTDKHVLYQNITSKIKQREASMTDPFVSRKARPQQRKVRFIPIFSLTLMIAIVLLMIPSFLKKQEDTELTTSQLHGVRTSEDELTLKDNLDEGSETSANKTQNNETADSTNNYTTTTDDREQVVYGAVAEPKKQYVIPFSVVVSETENLEQVYNRLDTFIESDDWGLADYPLTDITFDINLDNQAVFMDMPSDFTIGEGSADAHMFELILTHMFQPYGINEIQFSRAVDLGSHIGSLSTMPLYPTYESYKVFQADTEKRKFLVPVPLDEQATITEAFANMKEEEATYNVFASIPEHINVVLEAKDTELVITFADDAHLKDEQSFIMMLEAMLMTAKSYGFEHVIFEADIDSIGRFNMNEKIAVPEAVNPIH